MRARQDIAGFPVFACEVRGYGKELQIFRLKRSLSIGLREFGIHGGPSLLLDRSPTLVKRALSSARVS